MFIKELRSSTMSAHQALDKMLIPCIKSIETPVQYGDLLKCFYGYFSRVEEQLSLFLSNYDIPKYDERRKAHVIVQELESIGLPFSSGLADIPQIDTKAKAMGAMYVSEGSTLGGKIIAKIIGGNLGIDPAQLRFFNYYGDNTEAMWKGFSDALNDYADSIDQPGRDEMIQAAIDTFHYFKNWIERTYLPQKQL